MVRARVVAKRPVCKTDDGDLDDVIHFDRLTVLVQYALVIVIKQVSLAVLLKLIILGQQLGNQCAQRGLLLVKAFFAFSRGIHLASILIRIIV